MNAQLIKFPAPPAPLTAPRSREGVSFTSHKASHQVKTVSRAWTETTSPLENQNTQLLSTPKSSTASVPLHLPFLPHSLT